MTARCATCDRAECPWIPYAAMNCAAFDAVDANLTFAASQDCRAHSDWRARAIAAETQRDAAIREADRDHWRRTELAPRLATLEAAVAVLRDAATHINSDYRPTCYSAPYGNGCAGADAESVAFWRAAVSLAEAPMPDCHGTGAYCKGPCVRHGTLVDPEAA